MSQSTDRRLPLLEAIHDNVLITLHLSVAEWDLHYCLGKSQDKKKKGQYVRCRNKPSHENCESIMKVRAQFSALGQDWDLKGYEAEIEKFLGLAHCYCHRGDVLKKFKAWKCRLPLADTLPAVDKESEMDDGTRSSHSNDSAAGNESPRHGSPSMENEHACDQVELVSNSTSSSDGASDDEGESPLASALTSFATTVVPTSDDSDSIGKLGVAHIDNEMSQLSVARSDATCSPMDLDEANSKLETGGDCNMEDDAVQSEAVQSPPSVLNIAEPEPGLEPSLLPPAATVQALEPLPTTAQPRADPRAGCVCQQALPAASGPKASMEITADQMVEHVLEHFAAAAVPDTPDTSTARTQRHARLALAKTDAQRALWSAIESKAAPSDQATGTVYIRRHEPDDGLLHIGWTCSACGKQPGQSCYLTRTSLVRQSDQPVLGASRIARIMAAQLSAQRQGIAGCAVPGCQKTVHSEWFRFDGEHAIKLLEAWIWFVQRPAYNMRGDLSGQGLGVFNLMIGYDVETAAAFSRSTLSVDTEGDRMTTDTGEQHQGPGPTFDLIIEKNCITQYEEVSIAEESTSPPQHRRTRALTKSLAGKASRIAATVIRRRSGQEEGDTEIGGFAAFLTREWQALGDDTSASFLKVAGDEPERKGKFSSFGRMKAQGRKVSGKVLGVI
ncbi:hypothetical protein Micbo1qcDRAFT_166758 [Microdochium bolleyi]|uniref:Uncharacterized protein n=1 Tax=Microdochium bolleyi TaxID=196109 RepID=A0A136ITH0_9PEZI|nr:hypothetical protein Micbo1qcDRAFT_166758 [Microdochium bolleyi]